MDSIIENQHFGLTPFSPPDLNATLSNKKVWNCNICFDMCSGNSKMKTKA